MGGPKKNSSSPAAQYFAEVLRMLRTKAGLSQNELGERMNYTGAAVSAVETCAKPATDEFIEAAEKALDAGGLVAAAAKYLRLERYPAHFQGFVQLEQEALSVSSYCVQLIHGLLQAESYARALYDHAVPPLEPEEIEQHIAARMDRKALFDRKPVAMISVVVEEAGLRRLIGGECVMRRQYEHLVECAARPNVALQVMPMSRAGHACLAGPLTVIETPEEVTLVYLEGQGNSHLVSKPDEVGVLARRYAMIRTQALNPEESVSLIKQLAGEL
ncbi:helix-turn-helix domain-containing protein [Streptomyces sp. PSKA54]|uniref:Helix-turn-helix domain-containing protein n=1 Tax=Streptomyces himalayensis subsp. aureolus TaxID=2758039 RepID=A0A7W2CWS0_9ACTN|nr:helix-turn-helix transcriptional regulator [Streptomyces himalayensis]MBA4860540.1 helix-turn-helix domain-containing protein [Streptomyces himalayensis subsp. aureolus]